MPIRLGILSTVGHVKLSRFLAKFEKEFHGVDLEVSEGGLHELKIKLENVSTAVGIQARVAE